MTQAAYLFAAFLIGAGGATQTAMLGFIGKERGSLEASWISMLSTAAGLAILLVVRSQRGQTDLPAPLHRIEAWIVVAAIVSVVLAFSMRGIAPQFAIVGLFGLAFVAGAAFLIPQIGVSGFVVGATVGTLIAGLVLDHTGSFGIDVRPVTLVRVAGVGLALVGAIVVQASD